MEFKRKDHQTNKILYALVILIGLALAYWGVSKWQLLLNVFVFPAGVITIWFGYKNFKNCNNIITEIIFNEQILILSFIDGRKKEIELEKLRYALLIQRFYKPVRSVEFIEKKGVGLFRGKSIGRIEVDKWEKDMEPIARYLIQGEFERKKWKFGWGIGEVFLIFAIVLGFGELLVEDYVASTLTFSNELLQVGDIVADQEEKTIAESMKAEEKFFKGKS